MDELAEILRSWRDAARRRAAGADAHDAVLATVVHVRGSAYRRPGARMLILGDRTRIGTISGGCLETDVVRKAWWWTDEGAAIRTFDNTTEDAAQDFGLGCNGVITVLLERVASAGTGRLLEFLDARRSRREAAVIATVVRAAAGGDLAVGDHLLHGPDGIAEGGQPAFTNDVSDAVQATFGERCSRLVHLEDADVFVEWIGPPQRLFVLGAGHDAIPLATMAGMMGWSVTVADSRPSRLQTSRFPDAERLFAIPPSGDLSALDVRDDDAVVLMTHNYPEDLALLPQLVRAGPRYLGLLGPRVRAERIFGEIGSNVDAPNVHAPVGLDIGGDRPQSIALAIVAEIQSVVHGQPGGHLRRRRGAIHAPALETGLAAPGTRRRPDALIQPSCLLAPG